MTDPLSKRPRLDSANNNNLTINNVDDVSLLLPKEILLYIFSFLNAGDLVNCSLVNWRWTRVASNPTLWASLFVRVFPNASPEAEKTKAQFERYWRIQKNLSRGFYTQTRVNQTIFRLQHARTLGGKPRDFFVQIAPGTLKILDFKNNCEIELVLISQETIKDVQLLRNPNKVLTLSDSDVLKIWDLGKGCVTSTLQQVRRVESSNGHLAVIFTSKDTLEIWDLKTEKQLATHPKENRKFQLMKGNKAILTNGSAFELWDLSQKKCLVSCEYPVDSGFATNFFEVGENTLILDTAEGIEMWDLNKKICVNETQTPLDLVLALKNGSFICKSSEASGSSFLFNPKTSKTDTILFSNIGSALELEDGNILVAADGNLGILNIETEQYHKLGDSKGIRSLSQAPDGKVFIFRSNESHSHLEIWDLNRSTCCTTIELNLVQQCDPLISEFGKLVTTDDWNYDQHDNLVPTTIIDFGDANEQKDEIRVIYEFPLLDLLAVKQRLKEKKAITALEYLGILGLTDPKAYSTLLQVSIPFLNQVGISSLPDLAILGIAPDFMLEIEDLQEGLRLTPEISPDQKSIYPAVATLEEQSTKVLKNADTIITLLDLIPSVVATSSKIDLDKWKTATEQLKILSKKLEQALESPHALIAFFSNDFDATRKEFAAILALLATLEKARQIGFLETYFKQYGISATWKTLKASNPALSLSQIEKKPISDYYTMGL